MCCDNCSWAQVKEDPADPYYFDMSQVCSLNVKDNHFPLRVVKLARTLKTSKILHLCSKCHTFLVRGGKKCKPTNYPADNWSYMWSSFYWNLLTGYHASTDVPFHQAYDPETL